MAQQAAAWATSSRAGWTAGCPICQVAAVPFTNSKSCRTCDQMFLQAPSISDATPGIEDHIRPLPAIWGQSGPHILDMQRETESRRRGFPSRLATVTLHLVPSTSSGAASPIALLHGQVVRR